MMIRCRMRNNARRYAGGIGSRIKCINFIFDRGKRVGGGNIDNLAGNQEVPGKPECRICRRITF